MKTNLYAALVFTAMVTAVGGCSKQADQSFPALDLQMQTEELARINSNLIDTPNRVINNRLAVVGDKLVLTYDAPQGKRGVHNETVAYLADLDFDTARSIEFAELSIASLEVECKGGKNCVRHNADGKQDAYAPTSNFTVGLIWGGAARAIASNLEAVLIYQQKLRSQRGNSPK